MAQRFDNGVVAARVSSPVFVGRADQLERVLDAVRRASDGEPSFVLVSGDAGVGKTRFIEEVGRRANSLGVRMLTGGCVQMGEDRLPYAPIVEALRRLANEVPAADLRRLVGSGSFELTQLVPDFATAIAGSAAPRDEASPSDQGRLFEALLGLLRRLADDQPLLLATEDLHWADGSTMSLLGYLARNLSGAMVLVATYRMDELHRRHPLLPFLAEVERRPHVDRIELRPFDRREISELVRAIRSEPTDRELIDQVYGRSDGNAFYVEELLATGARSDELPASLRDVLSARIAELTDLTQAILQYASAAGPDTSSSFLQQVSGIDETGLRAGLREAIERHILTTLPPGDRIAFRHALMKEAVYETLLPWERTRTHAAFAAALEATPAAEGDPAQAAQLAYHWHAANDAPRALQAATRAAEAFDRVLAPADAYAQYERVLELWDQVPEAAGLAGLDRLDVLKRAAAAASIAAPRRAVALMHAAISIVDPGVEPLRAGQLWEILARYLWAVGDGFAAVDACRIAVQLVPPSPPSAERAKALASLGRLLMNTAQNPEARLVLEEAIALARATGAESVEGYGLNSLGVVLGYQGEIEAGRDRLLESREIARRLGSPDEVARADSNLIDLMVHVEGRFDDAAALAREAFAYVRDHHLVHFYGVYELCEGAGGLIRAGRWGEAKDLLDRASGFESAGIPEIFLNERFALLEVYRGQHDAAAARISLIRRLIGGSVDIQWSWPLVELTAELELWQGLPNDARREIAVAFDRFGDPDGGNISRVGPVVALALRAEADQGEVARSRHLEREFDQIRRLSALYIGMIRRMHDEILRGRPPQVRLAVAYLLVCEAEASRAEGHSSPDLWSKAAVAFSAQPMPYQQAYARWRESQALLVARERPGARRSLLEAYEIANRLGAEPLRHVIEATARPARIALDDARPVLTAEAKPLAAFGLTTRELEVLQQLVAAQTNREIAETLFISENTAGVHVSNILGKLGVTRRMEAASIARQLGLVVGGAGDDRDTT